MYAQFNYLENEVSGEVEDKQYDVILHFLNM